MSSIDYALLGTVTVTFNPDILLLKAQFRALPSESPKVVVDNASDQALMLQIEQLSEEFEHVAIVRNEKNIGLAAAINQGVQQLSAMAPKTLYVLLLDQDSVPIAQSVYTLLAVYNALAAKDKNVGCVGPYLFDPATQLAHGFHQVRRWHWKRVYPPRGSSEAVACVNLNGSGTLTSIELFQALGGVDEKLFIDHVDTDWAFRVQASGHTLWGAPSAIFEHCMGQNSVRLWCFGWRLWPLRTPKRQYFLYRNAIFLMKKPYVPSVWKVWAIAKLILTMLITAVVGPERNKQIRNMLKGIVDGVQGGE
ncbi:glycosyltransferase [Dyella jejuensis]|uniref:Glycosyltransferase n=1 Tax=Dyella jejuensis TaxID=1432009 RepID=A0ABW8JKN6_9GAMM